MELVSMVKDIFQNVAEHVVSYPIGQTALRYLDKTLSVVEKCARWAVPPPLDQDERPQPELVRPLPWVFFLCMLIILRIMRETISFANLIMGKPPLRSADVVTYIQSKRRYLRTLKYQGNRIMRARTSSVQPRESWYNSLRSLFEFTMCFRRNSLNYGNNNTTSVSNNEEVLVVKRSKRGREDTSPVTSGSVESTMERLIEKMMVDLNADSDEDSAYTLTDVTSLKSEKSELTAESDQDTVVQITSPPTKTNSDTPEKNNDDIYFAPPGNAISSTPEKTENTEQKKENTKQKKENPEQTKENTEPKKEKNELEKDNFQLTKQANEMTVEDKKDNAALESVTLTLEQESLSFIQNERCTQNVLRTPKNEKIANGRTVKSVASKKKGSQMERREHNATTARKLSENKSF